MVYPRGHVSNIVSGAHLIEKPYALKNYIVTEIGAAEPITKDPLYDFAKFLDERINDGTIDIQSGVGFLIESLNLNINTVVFWGDSAKLHVPHPYLYILKDEEWTEASPEDDGLFCLHEYKILCHESDCRRQLLESDKKVTDWKKYFKDFYIM